jgi:putative transposase
MWTAFARTLYERLNARCASDVIDDEYRLIKPLLASAKRDGRRQATDLREVPDAILDLIRTGCPWDILPEEFPPKSAV